MVVYGAPVRAGARGIGDVPWLDRLGAGRRTRRLRRHRRLHRRRCVLYGARVWADGDILHLLLWLLLNILHARLLNVLNALLRCDLRGNGQIAKYERGPGKGRRGRTWSCWG